MKNKTTYSEQYYEILLNRRIKRGLWWAAFRNGLWNTWCHLLVACVVVFSVFVVGVVLISWVDTFSPKIKDLDRRVLSLQQALNDIESKWDSVNDDTKTKSWEVIKSTNTLPEWPIMHGTFSRYKTRIFSHGNRFEQITVTNGEPYNP